MDVCRLPDGDHCRYYDRVHSFLSNEVSWNSLNKSQCQVCGHVRHFPTHTHIQTSRHTHTNTCALSPLSSTCPLTIVAAMKASLTAATQTLRWASKVPPPQSATHPPPGSLMTFPSLWRVQCRRYTPNFMAVWKCSYPPQPYNRGLCLVLQRKWNVVRPLYPVFRVGRVADDR